MIDLGPKQLPLGTAVRAMRPRDWATAVGVAALTWLVLGIPSDIVPNPIFGRPIPVRAIDHVILTVSALLTGLVFGLRSPSNELTDAEERPLFAGGILTFFAVGCPVCNRFVVSLLGTSGALNWFRPIQPVLGLAAVGLLVVAIRRRLADLADPRCSVPD
ncbi:MAG: hypothetical protein P8N50_10335 [Actinomycetota bacterium]|nr:hypothetical protein [Actinomycetota bacterium]